MQKQNGIILYSASDIVNFLDCEHLTALDLIDLETPLPRAEDDEEAVLYQNKGFSHELAHVERLKGSVASFADISEKKNDMDAAFALTTEAMRSGTDIIYQATLLDGHFLGHADFLKKVPHRSALGDFSYEVVDTKLARSTRFKFIIQLCYYSELLSKCQGRDPLMIHVVLGDGREESYRYAEYSKYYAMLKRRFLVCVQEGPRDTYPEECEHCDVCRWRDICGKQWIRDDHLNQVANITRVQIKRLCDSGITTLEALAKLRNNIRVPKMAPETLAKLRHQASLQLKKRETGESCFDLLPPDAENKRGFARLPRPDKGDIFFDMEGDPMEEDGLEYLFGVYCSEKGRFRYKPIWAHTREDEKAAFTQFMDLVTQRLNEYPNAHIYHYGHYEETALKRLMSYHGIREAEVDNLLRMNRLVDLYKVVREGLRISEPRYSLKNVEHFYLEERSGEIKDAAASIVYYERWKETDDDGLLNKIRDYNHDDVRSTYGLRQWLLTIRPKGMPWANEPGDIGGDEPQKIDDLNEIEKAILEYRKLLVDPLPVNREEWDANHEMRELAFQLLDFHRREAKPRWWALFARMEMTSDELIEDAEAIGGMTMYPGKPPYQDKRSYVYTYTYPEQETKIKTGDECVVTDTLVRIRNVAVDEDNFRVTFSYPVSKGMLPKHLSIGLGGPIDNTALRGAVARFADDLISGGGRYAALEAILRQDLPKLKKRVRGTAIIDESKESLSQVTEALAGLDNSYIFMQGPPGTGKTYTGSRVIVELIRRGFRVGVSSNSHKAINNLLSHVERVARERGMKFSGAKKSISNNEDSKFKGTFIEDVYKNEDLLCGDYRLIAGTAWLFSDEGADRVLDFLFVDEAGQVSLANLVAMGTSARNIVLLGDQMQLGQPIQGVHPGRSGESSLDYLLNGMATIPPEQGIFLNTTWRMHPDLCRFISEAVYDGRLRPEGSNERQCLILAPGCHPVLKATGVRYVPVEHDACSQRSAEEAEVVKDIYESLLKQSYRNKKGRKLPVTSENILVVAPYNMQVNLLKQTLPRGARVGTVDKFQGQEAEVVIISMATSNGDYMPHHIEFLYSKNRLNVALSRAKCLAILVANPALMTIQCTTVEQIALVNTLCWVKEYSDGGM